MFTPTFGGGRLNFFPDDEDGEKKRKKKKDDPQKQNNPPPPPPPPEPAYPVGGDDDDDGKDEHWLPQFNPKTQEEQEEEARLAEEREKSSPWPEPVNGAELLAEVRRDFNDHVIMPVYGDVACSLWTAHCYIVDLFEFSPRLFIRAAGGGSGKTTLLELLEKLIFRALLLTDATGAALLRLIEEHYILLADEHDSMMFSHSIRNVFNSGFKKSGKTVRSGKIYPTFAPFALASNLKLHPTMEDRSIVIRLKPRLKTEIIKDLRDFDAMPIRRKLLRWARDSREALKAARPQFPPTIFSRRADTWGPLLAIADVAGGVWPRLARKAAVALSVKRSQTDQSVLLLDDIKEAFGDEEALSSAELVNRLVGKADAPWAAHGLNQWSLADKLEAFEVHPRKLRIRGILANGYRRSSFTELWERWSKG
jgi:hypothetical protein